LSVHRHEQQTGRRPVGALRRQHHSRAASGRDRPRRSRAHEGRASRIVGTSRLGVGVIGIGFGQAVHAPAFQSDPRCQVVAICASTSMGSPWGCRTRGGPADSGKGRVGSGGGAWGGFGATAFYLVERLFAPVVSLSSPSASWGIAAKRISGERELVGGLKARLTI